MRGSRRDGRRVDVLSVPCQICLRRNRSKYKFAHPPHSPTTVNGGSMNQPRSGCAFCQRCHWSSHGRMWRVKVWQLLTAFVSQFALNGFSSEESATATRFCTTLLSAGNITAAVLLLVAAPLRVLCHLFRPGCLTIRGLSLDTLLQLHRRLRRCSAVALTRNVQNNGEVAHTLRVRVRRSTRLGTQPL